MHSLIFVRCWLLCAVGVFLATCDELRGKVERTLKAYDADGDGKISYDELADVHLSDGKDRADIVESTFLMGGFPAGDTDGDEFLTVAELTSLIKMYDHGAKEDEL
mmetsp:Transcript_33307/g.51835  ORF Transcript_33307/g.51835 Transcript_33307/m.51835 type:complete len:106 (-) Transcript_33307:9-326(-)